MTLTFLSAGINRSSSIRRSVALVSLAASLCLVTSSALAQVPVLRIDDVAEGAPVLTLNGVSFTVPTAGDAESVEFIIPNLTTPNFTPVSFILDEPGHTTSSDELSIKPIQLPGAVNVNSYDIFWSSDIHNVLGGGSGIPPNPNNPVETGAFQQLYNDGTLKIEVRSDLDGNVPDGGSTASLLLMGLAALPFAARLRIARSN